MKKSVKKTVACFGVIVSLIAGTSGCGANGGKAVLPDFTGSETEHSELYVEKIDGITNDFIRGADVSSYVSEIESGVVYYDFEGNKLDDSGFFKLLAESGVNLVRIRVWNDPNDSKGNSYGGGHNDLDTAVKIGKFASDAGMQVMIDFHYSDFWADPSKQKAPKAWAHMVYDDVRNSMYDFTESSLKTLLDAGVNVTMVQVGNETNNGIAGQTEWSKMIELMKNGCAAVRSVSEAYKKDIKVTVHYTNVNTNQFTEIADRLAENDVDYDVFAASYYPFWHGTLDNLKAKLSYVAETYDKEVMVAEVSYTYTLGDGDGHPNSINEESVGVDFKYEVSVQGQANTIHDVAATVISIGEKGIGICYWEPAWIPVNVYDYTQTGSDAVLEKNKALWEQYGSGWASSYTKTYDPKDAAKYYGGSSWDNQALFDYYGHPLESLKTYKYLFSGTDAQIKVARVDDAVCEAEINGDIIMPETVSTLLNSGETVKAPVTWDAEAVAAAKEKGLGDYKIAGKASYEGKEYEVACELQIKKLNYIKNPGFEDLDMSMWKISGTGEMDRTADNNKRSGTYCLKFYGENGTDLCAVQEIDTSNMEDTYYSFTTYIQGGDAGKDPVIKATVCVDGKEYTATGSVSGWLNWCKLSIDDIYITKNSKVEIKVDTVGAAGFWGAWDDFVLEKKQ